MYDLCIAGGLIVTDQEQYEGHLYISNGVIEHIDNIQKAILPSEKIIDATGKYVMPGFIDPHSHLNDPGLTESEDFYTGTCSAAAGGITTVLEHPLTFPLPSNLKNLSDKKDIADGKAVVDYALWGALTPDNYEDIEAMMAFGAVAFKGFMPYSVEIPQLHDGALYEHFKRLSKKDILVGIHCENDGMVRYFTEQTQKKHLTKPKDYELGRPEIAEIEAVNRVGLLSEMTGCKVHVVHCSSPKAVDIVQEYKDKGADISVETCTHYLALSTEDVESLGAFGVCNPPIRSSEHVNQLKEMVRDGTIDFVGSDHATYTFEEKTIRDNNVFNVPAGLTGIQTCFPLLYHQLFSKSSSCLKNFVKYTSTHAAKRFNIYPQKGSLNIGSDGDVVIFDPKGRWTVSEDTLLYKMKWSPYMNWTLNGAVDKTVVRGTVVFDGDNICVPAGFGRFVRPIGGNR